jgi:hypothetical protein
MGSVITIVSYSPFRFNYQLALVTPGISPL